MTIEVPSGYTEFENCVVRKESKEGIRDEGGLLVEFDNGDVTWIPKSQIHGNSEVYEFGTDGTLIIPEWLAIEKELV